MLKTVTLTALNFQFASALDTPAAPTSDPDPILSVQEGGTGLTVGVAAIILTGLALFLAKSLSRSFDHDENQFVASAYLLARGGLLPYRDYSYFHTPYLIFVYAAIFRWTSHLLLSARLCSVFCGVACYGIVLRCVAKIQPAGRWLLYSTAIIFVAQPVAMYTSGRAWNHDMPVLLILLAFVALRRTKGSAGEERCWFVGGLLAGLATGLRITFVVTLPAMCLCALLDTAPLGAKRKTHRVGRQIALLGGFALAMVPLAMLVSKAPAAFVFDNFRYPLVNLQWRRSVEGVSDGLVAAKGRFIMSFLLNQPANLGLLALFIPAMLALAFPAAWLQRFKRETQMLGILSAALLCGAIIPTPTYMPYFYAPVPFMLLAAAYAAGQSEGRRLILWRRCFIGVAIASLPMGLAFYCVSLANLVQKQCLPLKIHDTGVRASEMAGGRPILTLAPIFAMEGGAMAYSQFATGPFAFRIAPLVSEAEELQDHLPDPDDIEWLVGANPPGLVLIGNEGDSEQPLIEYAHKHAIRTMYLSDDCRLFAPGNVPAKEPHLNWSNISSYFVDQARRLFKRR